MGRFQLFFLAALVYLAGAVEVGSLEHAKDEIVSMTAHGFIPVQLGGRALTEDDEHCLTHDTDCEACVADEVVSCTACRVDGQTYCLGAADLGEDPCCSADNCDSQKDCKSGSVKAAIWGGVAVIASAVLGMLS